MKLGAVLATLALAVAGVAASAAPADAASAPIRITMCGQKVSGDAYLDRNLRCSTGVGIELVAGPDTDAVSARIDMRGHTLFGPGSGTGVNANRYPASTSLQLVNGRVGNWAVGVDSSFGSLDVSKVRFATNDTAISCNSGCKVGQSVFSKNQVGTRAGEAFITLTDNVFASNGIGSLTRGSVTGGQSFRNVYRDNDIAVEVGTLSGLTLEHNVFTKNGVGIKGVEASAGAAIRQNIFKGNRDGIYIQPADDQTYTIGQNITIKNSRYGIHAPGATDLGGNIGIRNGQQCLGVVCRTS